MQGLLIESFKPFCIHFFTFIHSKKNPQGSNTEDTVEVEEGGSVASLSASHSFIISCLKFLFDPFTGLKSRAGVRHGRLQHHVALMHVTF